MTAAPPVAMIAVGNLHPDAQNRPDKSGDEGLQGLAETIKALGVLVPLIVGPHPSRKGHYVILDGYRRWLAAQMAGVGELRCEMRRPGSAMERAAGPALIQVVTATQRNPLSAVELALAFGRLCKGGMTPADIGRYTGLTSATVSYHMELLELDDAALAKVRRGEIQVGAAHEIVKDARAAGGGELRPGPVAPRSPSRAYGTRPRTRKPPAYFNGGHPLAHDAFLLCQREGHEAWTRLGKTACGPCFEAVIIAAHSTPPRPGEVLASLGLTPDDLTPAALARIGLADPPPPHRAAPVPAAAFSGGGRA